MARKILSSRLRRTSLLFVLCLTFLIGVGLASQFYAGAWFWWLFLLPLLLSLRRRSPWTLLWVILLGMSLGLWRGGLYQDKLASFNDYYDTKVTATVIASQDAAYGKFKQLTFDSKNVVIDSTGERLTGKVSISGFGLNAVYAGDEIQVKGKLKSSLGSYQGRMSYAQLTLVAHHNSVVNELRRRFVAGVQSGAARTPGIVRYGTTGRAAQYLTAGGLPEPLDGRPDTYCGS